MQLAIQLLYILLILLACLISFQPDCLYSLLQISNLLLKGDLLLVHCLQLSICFITVY